MTIQQEAYEKIMKLPDDGIRLIIVLADEIARQYEANANSSSPKDNLVSRKQIAFQSMLKKRESSLYPANIDYKMVMEESINETYHIPN